MQNMIKIKCPVYKLITNYLSLITQQYEILKTYTLSKPTYACFYASAFSLYLFESGNL